MTKKHFNTELGFYNKDGEICFVSKVFPAKNKQEAEEKLWKYLEDQVWDTWQGVSVREVPVVTLQSIKEQVNQDDWKKLIEAKEGDRLTINRIINNYTVNVNEKYETFIEKINDNLCAILFEEFKETL